MKNLQVSSIVGCVADKQGLLLMANLLQDGELLYHVDKKVCEVDRFTSARTSFTSPIYRSSKNSSHQATQIVTKCCRSVLQYFSAVRDRSRKNFQSTGRWSSAVFFLHSSSSCKLTACVDKVLECVTSLYWWSVAIENTRTQQP